MKYVSSKSRSVLKLSRPQLRAPHGNGNLGSPVKGGCGIVPGSVPPPCLSSSLTQCHIMLWWPTSQQAGEAVHGEISCSQGAEAPRRLLEQLVWIWKGSWVAQLSHTGQSLCSSPPRLRCSGDMAVASGHTGQAKMLWTDLLWEGVKLSPPSKQPTVLM